MNRYLFLFLDQRAALALAGVVGLLLTLLGLANGQGDFLINVDAEGDLQQRNESAIARNTAGDYVVAWRDERNGNHDVFVQRFNASGEALGRNLRVNDDIDENEQWAPDVAIDDEGNFIVTWGARNPRSFDVLAQRYSSLGVPIGGNFQVNERSQDSDHHANVPAVAMSPDGRFTIVWNDARDDHDDIWAQRYSASGARAGSNIKVNADGDTQWGLVRPGIGMDGNGTSFITWSDNRSSGVANVYVQIIGADGTMTGDNLVVNDTGDLWFVFPAMRPSIAVSRNSHFVIAWEDGRNGFSDPDIYAQAFTTTGARIGTTNVRVNDDSGGQANQQHVNLAIDDSGNFAVTWTDKRDDSFGDVMVQRYDASSNPLGANFLADDLSGLGIQEEPDIAMDGTGNFVVSWSDDHGPDAIFARRFGASGDALAPPDEANDDLFGGTQDQPAVGMNESSRSVVVWRDTKNNFSGDVYFQRYDGSGNPDGGNVKVNDDEAPPYSVHEYPDVAINQSGQFVVVWVDERNGGRQIYAQQYDANGTQQGANLRVTTEDSGFWNGAPAVALADTGSFFVAWEDDRDRSDIYGRLYTPKGTPAGPDFRVNEESSRTQHAADVDMDASGNFVVVWRDERWGYKNTALQRYNSAGVPQGANLRVSDAGAYQNSSPSVTLGSAGDIHVCWTDQRNHTGYQENNDVFYQKVDAAGNLVGSNVRVNDDASTADQSGASITAHPSMDRVFIAWTDHRNGKPELMAQRYAGGVADGANTVITDAESFPYHHKKTNHFSAASGSDWIGLAFMDNRQHRHWDIYGARLSWTPAESGGSFEITGIELANGNVTLTWTSKPGKVYAIEQGSNLSVWQEVDSGIVSAGNETSFTFARPDAAARYFRVKEP